LTIKLGKASAAWDDDNIDMHRRVLLPALVRAEIESAYPRHAWSLALVDEMDWKGIVDFIIDVHKRYKLQAPSLYLAPRLAARFLETEIVPCQHHRLLGAAALIVASKFEEEEYPDMQGLATSAGCFSSSDVQAFELRLLHGVGFRLHVPTAAHFLPWFKLQCGCGCLHEALTDYLSELGMSRLAACTWLPSLHAAAAAILAAAMLGQPAVKALRSLALTSATGSRVSAAAGMPTAEALDATLRELRIAVKETRQDDAVYRKFAQEDRLCASLRAVQLSALLAF